MTKWIFDVAAIMKSAHEKARKMTKWQGTYAAKFQMCLRVAWGEAKIALENAKKAEAQAVAAEAQKAILSQSVVSYRGRNYKMIWHGQTKYGHRAKLAFMDGSKEFWVDAKDVREAIKVVSRTVSHICEECGTRPAVTTARDCNGIVGHVCARCASMPASHRSFA